MLLGRWLHVKPNDSTGTAVDQAKNQLWLLVLYKAKTTNSATSSSLFEIKLVSLARFSVNNDAVAVFTACCCHWKHDKCRWRDFCLSPLGQVTTNYTLSRTCEVRLGRPITRPAATGLASLVIAGPTLWSPTRVSCWGDHVCPLYPDIIHTLWKVGNAGLMKNFFWPSYTGGWGSRLVWLLTF